jgi:hypothetical protein
VSDLPESAPPQAPGFPSLSDAGLAPPGQARWRTWAVRAALLYSLGYFLPVVVCFLPSGEHLAGAVASPWQLTAAALGRSLLHLAEAAAAGRGDRLVDHLAALVLLLAAAAVALLWTLLGSRSAGGRRLDPWLRVWLRGAVAVVLLGMAMRKFAGVEFPPLTVARLQERIGETSPFILLSTFMGYSAPYVWFCAGLEALAGLLLLVRRTVTLGALIALGVLGNVLVLDVSYDVPTRLLSLHLLLATLYLLAPDGRRIVAALLFGRATEPAPAPPPLWPRRVGMAATSLAIAAVLLLTAGSALAARRELSRPPESPLAGAWEVEAFAVDGRPLQLWPFDPTRWRRLTFASATQVVLMRLDGSRAVFGAACGEHRLALADAAPATGPDVRGTFDWRRPDSDHLLLRGTFDQRALDLRLRRLEPASYLLINRGFRLIDDAAINR